MKKAVMAIGVIIGLFILISGGFLLKLKSETDLMTPVSTGLVAPGIFAVQDGFVNFFLVQHEDKFIAIDAGNDPDMAAAELENFSINPDLIDAVLLTHSDSDHIAAVNQFTNATVYLPQLEEQMINGTKNRFLVFSNSLDFEYELLQDGQKLIFNDVQIVCIATPGHTPGSMNFLVDGKYLFVGDNLSLKEGKADLFNNFFNMDSKTQKESLKILANLEGVSDILSAHYGVVKVDNNTFERLK